MDHTTNDAPTPPAHRCIEVPVPLGGRALIVSALHLTAEPETAKPTQELVQALTSWAGPGVLVLCGNTFDLADATVTAAALLTRHAALTTTLRAWVAKPGRRIVVLPGDRDARLAWSPTDRTELAERLQADVALAADLVAATGSGERRVRVDPGQRLDELAGRDDPTNPGATPLSYHLRLEVIPSVRAAQAAGRAGRQDWLAGMELLDDPATFPRFVASRLTYRMLGRRAWLLLVPLLVAIAFRVPSLAVAHAAGLAHPGSTRIVVLVAVTVVELVLLGVVAVASVRRTWRALAGITLGAAGREPNRAGRDLARTLIAEGYRGLVTGHTCRPELTDLGPGFYANAGCVAEVVSEHPARLPGLGLPPAYLARTQTSWVELEAGGDLHARLLLARSDASGATWLERIAARPSESGAPAGTRPQLVASFPTGESWPRHPSGQLRKRRIRRLGGLVVGLAGFVSLISSLSEPLRDRLVDVRHFVPIVVPETAAAVTAVAGVALLVLARGVRRGQRRAWAVTLVLLLVTVVSHLLKGADVEEAVLALAIAVFLWLNRREFEAATDTPRLRGDLARWAGVSVLTVAAGTIGIEVGSAIRSLGRRHHPFAISWVRAAQATVERMVGVDHVALPTVLDRFFGPALGAATAGLGLYLFVLLFRPVVARRRRSIGSPEATMARARSIVDRYGAGTLDYFALRPDKQFFFWGDTVVAHAVYGGVCLVSPDPIGPVTEREPAWRAFRSYVDAHGWALGGLGAGEDWLPVYRATGMHDLYVGDEGVVRLDRFSLDGGRRKGLRQAVNRVAKYGYTISFHDPASLDAELRHALQEVMTKSRRGDVERGFSMTLGRVFDPVDTGLLLAVVHAPGDGGAPGKPVAFCQYVPAPGIGGYSLDLMRRDDGDHPNGLIDFAVVETIRHLREHGGTGLGLNFATMRAVLAGETGEGPVTRVQAWLLRRMGDSMQIESLWRFNAKFDPDWLPRYATYDAPENAIAVAVAIARAESFWELPVIGRFLVPPADAEAAEPGQSGPLR